MAVSLRTAHAGAVAAQETPRDRQGYLLALVADLDDDTAAEVLAYARWLLAEERMLVSLEDLPVMWRRDDAPAGQERP